MTAATPFGFADEMRVGLRGTVRRVWGRRGVKVHQPLQLTYEWQYLFLVVDGRAGRLYWCWIDSMAADEVLAAVGACSRPGNWRRWSGTGRPATATRLCRRWGCH